MPDVDREPTFLAHSGNAGGRCESVREHIQPVARRAAEFAAPFGGDEQAFAAGLLHDVGKYSERFLWRITDRSAGPAGDHATAGAILALSCYKELGGIPAAAILGHHGGLDMIERHWKRWATSLADRVEKAPESVTEREVKLLVERFRADGFNFPPVQGGLTLQGVDADVMLDTRMLFSALVDADFIETEAHFAGDRQEPRRYRREGPQLEPERALAAVQAHLEMLGAVSGASVDVACVRRALQDSCVAAAEEPRGVFTLSAPTGSGKTLAMLAFALRHAAVRGQRRIVLVMPFLNIIDQTAGLYRQLFSPDAGFPENYVLEDHSLAAANGGADGDEQSESERLRRLLAENWDAPIILTTSVQCLESLMSNRPSACRKLHRLADSVVMFDEVQTLPRELVVATLGTLSRLCGRFGATILFATATQPAFEHLNERVREIATAGWAPRSVLGADGEGELFSVSARRTLVQWEHQTPVALEQLAERLARDPSNQLLCIVNLKRHAQCLAGLLRERNTEGVFHLSTSMCPAHRQSVLAEVQRRLVMGSPVRLISTQCVEAGVDIDFPVVFRALAPLEAIAQAAGRCNRHGCLPDPGRVYVFKPLDDEGRVIYPPGYKQAAQVTENYVNRKLADGVRPEAFIHDPHVLGQYFRELYALTGTGTQSDVREAELRQAMFEGNFGVVASKYRLIAADAINILVPYHEDEFKRLVKQIRSPERRQPGDLRQWIAAARPLTVAPYRPKADWPTWQHVDPIHFARHPAADDAADWWVALDGLEYDELLGLRENAEWQTII